MGRNEELHLSFGVMEMDLDIRRSHGVLERQACKVAGFILLDLDLACFELVMLRALRVAFGDDLGGSVVWTSAALHIK